MIDNDDDMIIIAVFLGCVIFDLRGSSEVSKYSKNFTSTSKNIFSKKL